MKYTKHNETSAVEDITKDVLRIRHIEHKLAIFRTPLDGSADKRMFGENLRFALDFCADDRCEARMAVVKKNGEAVEIGQRGCRPLQLHWFFQGLNRGVPQVSSQRTTSSCATVGSPALIAAHCRSSAANSASVDAAGAPPAATISASSSATDKPTSAARVSSAAAIASSTSMVRLLIVSSR